MDYFKYLYIYPPRPENAIPPKDIKFFDNGSLIGQPKLNGSNLTIYINGNLIIPMNRHGQRIANFKIPESEISEIYNGNGWMVVNGEYMNKGKLDENGRRFNDKFVIFDILVHENNYLVGKTFIDRVKILDNIYGLNNSDKKHLYSITPNIYRVKSYFNNFENIYSELIPIDMYEGLVLKRIESKLEIGSSKRNNFRGQIKIRKSSKSYKY